jgi:hypothetical protein
VRTIRSPGSRASSTQMEDARRPIIVLSSSDSINTRNLPRWQNVSGSSQEEWIAFANEDGSQEQPHLGDWAGAPCESARTVVEKIICAVGPTQLMQAPLGVAFANPCGVDGRSIVPAPVASTSHRSGRLKAIGHRWGSDRWRKGLPKSPKSPAIASSMYLYCKWRKVLRRHVLTDTISCGSARHDPSGCPAAIRK